MSYILDALDDAQGARDGDRSPLGALPFPGSLPAQGSTHHRYLLPGAFIVLTLVAVVGGWWLAAVQWGSDGVLARRSAPVASLAGPAKVPPAESSVSGAMAEQPAGKVISAVANEDPVAIAPAQVDTAGDTLGRVGAPSLPLVDSTLRKSRAVSDSAPVGVTLSQTGDGDRDVPAPSTAGPGDEARHAASDGLDSLETKAESPRLPEDLEVASAKRVAPAQASAASVRGDQPLPAVTEPRSDPVPPATDAIAIETVPLNESRPAVTGARRAVAPVSLPLDNTAPEPADQEASVAGIAGAQTAGLAEPLSISEPDVTEKVMNYAELPYEVQQQVSYPRFSVHLFAPHPANRLVKLGGAIFREGQSLGDGVTLDRITADGAILSYGDYRFRVGVQ